MSELLARCQKYINAVEVMKAMSEENKEEGEEEEERKGQTRTELQGRQ